ncbi:MAG: glycosyltransferase family 2 protein [Thermoanaerobaculia bacterium]
MNRSPRVSVIMIFFNGERFFREALESVFAQTFQDWELLLVDDGSADGSTAIAKEYAAAHPGRVRYLEHDGHRNHGQSVTRNLGVRHARGEFVHFLDQDDVLLPAALAEQVEILDAMPDAGIVFGSPLRWYSWTGRPEDRDRDFFMFPMGKMDSVFPPPELLTACIRGDCGMPLPSDFLVRREAILRAGGSEAAFTGSFIGLYEDEALCAKIFTMSPTYVSSKCWCWYRVHPGMASAAAVKTKQWIFQKANPAEMKYLTWLEQYLRESGWEGCEVWAALQKALWPYRHPAREALSNRLKWWYTLVFLNVGRWIRRVKKGSTGSIEARPNPIVECDPVGGVTATLHWTSRRAEALEVRMGSPDGAVFSRSGPSGEGATKDWAVEGMTFFLQDASAGRAQSLASSLDVVRLRVARSKD